MIQTGRSVLRGSFFISLFTVCLRISALFMVIAVFRVVFDLSQMFIGTRPLSYVYLYRQNVV